MSGRSRRSREWFSMASPSVLEGTPRKNPQSPREKGAECEMTESGRAPMEPFRWRRAFFLGLVSYAASLAGLVFDTFVPVLLQAGHPLWHNTTGLHAPLVGFALAPSCAFFIMTWDNLINLFIHPWAGVQRDQT